MNILILCYYLVVIKRKYKYIILTALCFQPFQCMCSLYLNVLKKVVSKTILAVGRSNGAKLIHQATTSLYNTRRNSDQKYILLLLK